jgi:isoleucyl-tRNA synthetase
LLPRQQTSRRLDSKLITSRTSKLSRNQTLFFSTQLSSRLQKLPTRPRSPPSPASLCKRRKTRKSKAKIKTRSPLNGAIITTGHSRTIIIKMGDTSKETMTSNQETTTNSSQETTTSSSLGIMTSSSQGIMTSSSQETMTNPEEGTTEGAIKKNQVEATTRAETISKTIDKKQKATTKSPEERWESSSRTLMKS